MDATLVRKLLAYRWFVFGIMAVAYILVNFHRLCPAVVALDLQTSLNATGGFMGLLASAYFYPYAIMQFPAGLLSDSLGPRKTVTFFLLIAALGSFLFSQAQSMESAMTARILVGLGVSMVFIPTMKLISQWFRVHEFSLMAGIMNTMGGLGALIAATPLALTTSILGWRNAFIIIAAASLFIALMVWILVRNKPQDLGWPALSEIDHQGPGHSVPPKTIPLLEGVKRVFSERYFIPVAIWFALTPGIFFAFGGLWAGPYLMHVYGITREGAGSILNMIAVGMIIGSPMLSIISERHLYSRKKVLMIVSAGMLTLMAFLNIFPQGLPIYSLYIIFLLFSISSSAIVVIGFTTTKELFPVEIAGTSVGTMNLFPFLGGAILQPVLGRILETYPKAAPGVYSLSGYRAMLAVLLIGSLIAFLATFFIKETFPGRSE